MIFLVLLGADMLNTTLALSQMPAELAARVKESGMAPLVVMFMILLIYIFLGCVMDSLAMILLTIPIFYPMVMGLDFFGMTQQDKSIWFGILALMVVEIGARASARRHERVHHQSPREGRAAHRDVQGRGSVPRLRFARILLLVFFPVISLYLVHTFKQ
jgi:hypothetical protein